MAEDEKKSPKGGATDTVGLGALAALVVLLGGIVWLALPKDGDREAAADAAPWSALGTEGGTLDDIADNKFILNAGEGRRLVCNRA